MPRRKGYERRVLVTRASKVFHDLGYHAASTEVLVRAMGVNRNSVYTEFGSKEGLLTAVLDQYHGEVVPHIFGPLESPTATLDQIETLFRSFKESAGDSFGLGCLMCNTAAELAGAGPPLKPLVNAYFERLRSAFGHALMGAARANQLKGDVSLAEEAQFLVSCCVGIFLMVRARIPLAMVHGSIDGAISHLGRLRRSVSLRAITEFG